MSLLAAAMEDDEEVAQPQVLKLLYQSRNFSVPIFPGSLMDWPDLARRELNVCIEAETVHNQRRKAYLARLQKDAEDALSKSRGNS